jgi:hypothetical protein
MGAAMWAGAGTKVNLAKSQIAAAPVTEQLREALSPTAIIIRFQCDIRVNWLATTGSIQAPCLLRGTQFPAPSVENGESVYASSIFEAISTGWNLKVKVAGPMRFPA